MSRVVVNLLKGVVYQDTHAGLWQEMRSQRARVSDYVRVLGLQLVVDESEGYAYLASLDLGDANVPRLVARRPLGYHVSLLLALLRKRMAELDAQGGDTRLVLTRDQIVDMLRIYLPETGNEARLLAQIDGHIKKTVELGFLRPLRSSAGGFEVRRIIKAFVDGQWLADLDAHLTDYLAGRDAGDPGRGPAGSGQAHQDVEAPA
ncbi:MAG: hypothetical protein CSA58_00970 [Micrococcales bacterium]|nr:MAG: hypothetical protein CSB46_02225 [Micrococcales bacterium]PIE28072.1 MAG: hypothetical protein CSA58_00970 [Micrococcales bacterium]